MKKKDILAAYALVNNAKLTKLEDDGKFKVIKALKEMKPIVEDFQDFEKDARKKLEGENHEELVGKAQKWQEDGENTTLTIKERKALDKYFAEYNDKVVACLKEEMEKDVNTNYAKLSEEELKKFIASNDWKVNETISVMDVLQ